MVRSSQAVVSSQNPVRRVRKESGLTLKAAAKEAGVHLQAFFLQEQGVYPGFLPAIAAWLILRSEEAVLVTEYRDYQVAKRRTHGELFGLKIYELGPPSSANSLVQLRRDLGLSRMGLAKRFCVHPGLLYRVESGLTGGLPDQLRTALEQGGMRSHVLDELNFRIGE